MSIAEYSKALVTGGSQGIGLATAEAFAARGLQVAAVARNLDRLRAAVDRFDPAVRDRVLVLPGDVSREDDVDAVVERTVAEFGGLDVLVNSAGVSTSARWKVEESPLAEWHANVDTNLTGTYLMCRAALPHLRAAGHGYVLNVLSIAAYRSSAGFGVYAASKYGTRALTEALIEEYRDSSVRVSSVSPGPVATSIWDHKLQAPTDDYRATMLRPDDIVDAFLWLLERPDRLHVPNITITPWVQEGGSRA